MRNAPCQSSRKPKDNNRRSRGNLKRWGTTAKFVKKYSIYR